MQIARTRPDCQIGQRAKGLATTSFGALWLALLIGTLLTACRTQPLFDCTDAIGCVDIAPGEPIKLGVIQALSGGAAPIGISQVRSIELAIAGRDDELLGHPIGLQIEDERCLPEGGTTASLKISADPQVVAVLGTTCSGAAATAAKVISEAGLVLISGGNTAPSLTAIAGKPGSDWRPGYFRTTYNDAVRGQAAAEFSFQELGLTRAATINDGDAFTKGFTDVFGREFTELGGEIVLAVTIDKGDTDIRPVLTAAAFSEADLIFFSLFRPEADYVVRQAKEVVGLENVVLFSGGLVKDAAIEAVGPAGRGMYLVGPTLLKGGLGDALRVEYTSRYGEPPLGDTFMYGYDAANMLLNAIETVAVKEEDGALHIGRQDLRDALYATDDFEGISGNLTCDEFGDCGTADLNHNIVCLDDPVTGLEGLNSNVVSAHTSD